MLQKIRRRDLILLSGLFAVACFSMITVVLLILRSQPAPANSAPLADRGAGVPGPAPTHTVTFVQITGLTQYPPAEESAQAWAADARLVSANADWPQVLNVSQMGEPTTWNYRFYSPSKRRLFFAVVEPDETLRTVEHRIPVTLPPATIELEAWRIDSPTALAIWLDYAGGQLLRRNPGLEVVAQLRRINNHPGPVWVIVGLDSRTDDIHIVAIDATEGTVVSTGPES